LQLSVVQTLVSAQWESRPQQLVIGAKRQAKVFASQLLVVHSF
jgi:hypothetical protein